MVDGKYLKFISTKTLKRKKNFRLETSFDGSSDMVEILYLGQNRLFVGKTRKNNTFYGFVKVSSGSKFLDRY